MDFFSEHTRLFQQYLLNESAVLYEYLKKLCASKNRDLSKLAYKAVEALFKEVYCFSSSILDAYHAATYCRLELYCQNMR